VISQYPIPYQLFLVVKVLSQYMLSSHITSDIDILEDSVQLLIDLSLGHFLQLSHPSLRLWVQLNGLRLTRPWRLLLSGELQAKKHHHSPDRYAHKLGLEEGLQCVCIIKLLLLAYSILEIYMINNIVLEESTLDMYIVQLYNEWNGCNSLVAIA